MEGSICDGSWIILNPDHLINHFILNHFRVWVGAYVHPVQPFCCAQDWAHINVEDEARTSVPPVKDHAILLLQTHHKQVLRGPENANHQSFDPDQLLQSLQLESKSLGAGMLTQKRHKQIDSARHRL